MRIKSYDGTVKNVRSVKPVVETRLNFNERTVRLAEVVNSNSVDATGLYFEFENGTMGCFGLGDTPFLVGNLAPRVVKDALNTLLTKDFIDISQWEYQKASRNTLLDYEEAVFDGGKTKPYVSFFGLNTPPSGIFECMPMCNRGNINPPVWDNEAELEDMRKAIGMQDNCPYTFKELAEMGEEELRKAYATYVEEE